MDCCRDGAIVPSLNQRANFVCLCLASLVALAAHATTSGGRLTWHVRGCWPAHDTPVPHTPQIDKPHMPTPYFLSSSNPIHAPPHGYSTIHGHSRTMSTPPVPDLNITHANTVARSASQQFTFAQLTQAAQGLSPEEELQMLASRMAQLQAAIGMSGQHASSAGPAIALPSATAAAVARAGSDAVQPANALKSRILRTVSFAEDQDSDSSESCTGIAEVDELADTPGRLAPGMQPPYSELARPVTAMVEATLHTSPESQFLSKVAANLKRVLPGRRPLVLVTTGAFNPVHLQHIRMFYLAREYLASSTAYQVVGGLISPAHDSAVRSAQRRFLAHAIPAKHRIAMVETAVAGSSWLGVGRWEATRRAPMDYPSVLKNMQSLLYEAFAEAAPLVMYLCGADHLIKCGPQTLKNFGCICCSRPGFTEQLERTIGKRWRRLVHIVDDDTVLSSALASVSSTKVRRRMVSDKPLVPLIGEEVARYVEAHKIREKVAGMMPWTSEDRAPVQFLDACSPAQAAGSAKPPAGGASRARAELLTAAQPNMTAALPATELRPSLSGFVSATAPSAPTASSPARQHSAPTSSTASPAPAAGAPADKRSPAAVAAGADTTASSMAAARHGGRRAWQQYRAAALSSGLTSNMRGGFASSG